MTNNPTIDGVSRDLYQAAINALQDEGRWDIADRLELAINAPVVERQSVEVPVVGKLVPNGGGYDCWHPAANQGQAVVLQSDHDEYVAALQSTIAQLQAQVAELESGKGEPAGEAGSMPGTSGFTMAAFKAYEVPIGTKLFTAPPAQVAVVLPTTEQFKDAFRATGYVTHDQAWELAEAAEACLDATAALNGERK